MLAAGEGLRMRPLTTSMPKVMLRVANKPILEHALESLIKAGIRDVIIVVGYKKEQIMSYFEDGNKWGANIRYAFEEKQLGTAHALSKVAGMVQGPFLVYPGDNIIGSDAIKHFLDKTSKDGESLLVVESARPAKYGYVVASGNHIQGIEYGLEPAVGNLISTGIYYFQQDIFDIIEEAAKNGMHFLTDVALSIIEKRKTLEGIAAPGRWMDTVHPWDMLDANENALSDMEIKTQGSISQKATIKGPVSVGEGSVIREGCYIQGPVIIGAGCEIGPNVVITPSTTIGDNVKIEAYTKIEQSVIMDDASIGVFSNINHTVIGQGVTIGGHFTTLVGKCDIKTLQGYHKMDHMGSIIGDDTTISPHVACLPGAIIGADCEIGPFNKIDGALPNESKVV